MRAIIADLAADGSHATGSRKFGRGFAHALRVLSDRIPE